MYNDGDVFAGDPFWDRMGPHEGPNLYARGKGEYVTGWPTAVIEFRTERSEHTVARGVMLMDDEGVYTWTVRRKGYEDAGGRRRLASRSRQTFREAAAGLLQSERPFIEPDLYAYYTRQVEKIRP